MPTFVDLFAGAGGMSLGLHAAGLDCVGVVENDPSASTTYRANLAALMPDTSMIRLGPEAGDMRRIGARQMADELARGGVEEGELDLLTAGPPCQGFSHVGRSKLDSIARQRGAFQHDERNELYLAVADLLPLVQPRAFVIENVPGILNHARVNVAERIAETAERHGYRVSVTVLNAAWYGIPQTRDRVFVLGYREDLGIPPTFPAPRFRAELSSSHLAGASWVASMFNDTNRFIQLRNPGPESPRATTSVEALGDLPAFTDHLRESYRSQSASRGPLEYTSLAEKDSYAELMRGWPDLPEPIAVYDHYARSTPRDHETFRRMSQGDRYPGAVRVARDRYVQAVLEYRRGREMGYKEPPPVREDFVPPYSVTSFVDKWRKLMPDQPSWTVTAHLSRDGYSHIHYDDDQARTITPREAARLQSFPDSFCLTGNMGDAFRQIGNAVPPLLAREIGEHVARCLEYGTPPEVLREQQPSQLPLVGTSASAR